jgi:L-2,4-diaminobutyrate transaminase
MKANGELMPLSANHNLPLEELDKRYFFHPATSISDHLTNGPRIMERGSGVRVTDSKGKSYIDGAAGLWCVNIGYGRTEVAEAIAEQAKKLAFFHAFTSMSNEPAIRLAEKVVTLAPKGMSRVFFGNSGSDANDTNIKLVWYYNNQRGLKNKKKIISRKRAYHGITLGGGSCTGLPINHEKFDLPLDRFRHTESVDQYREKPAGMTEEQFATHLAQQLENMILTEGPETVAAFIAEPLMGTGGVLPPPKGYFAKVQEVLDRYDVLMIADEVICGFGRLGSMFGSDHYGIRPDFMTLAKGLSSGYQPISGSIVSERVWKVLEDTAPSMPGFGHGFTYSAHPICAAAALANLEIVTSENLAENAATVGAHLKSRLTELLIDHSMIGDIRGEGLMMGIELVADKDTKRPLDPSLKAAGRVMKQGYEEGIICRALPHRDVIAMSPPLVLTKSEADEYAAGLAKSIRTVADQLMRSGEWSPKLN